MSSISYDAWVRCMGDIQHLDAALASLARQETALRLRLGQLLEVMGRGAVFELGFSSLGAYAVERCERSVRWVEAARSLARRLESLPQLRQAMSGARVSWSMGELLARVATPANEGRWLELAHSRTVRQMRALVTEAMSATPASATGETGTRSAGVEEQLPRSMLKDTAHVDDDSFANAQNLDSDGICVLTCTVDREDAWVFEATRCLLEQLGVNGAVAQADALLAEAQGTLLELLPEGTIDLGCLDGCNLAQQRWVEQLRRWRDEAEASCEKNVLADLLSTRASSEPAARLLRVALASSLGIAPIEQASCTELDQQVRALTAILAGHELELSLLVLRFHRADGWRKLGYATETQYARERLGLSRSALASRRTLALRLEKLPGVAGALGAALIGVEAALQLVRIATPKTEAAWLERARRRTIKHLREEVAAALTAVRLSGEGDCLPPEQTEMAAFQTLEQAAVSGRLGQPWSPSDVPERTGSPNLSNPTSSNPTGSNPTGSNSAGIRRAAPLV